MHRIYYNIGADNACVHWSHWPKSRLGHFFSFALLHFALFFSDKKSNRERLAPSLFTKRATKSDSILKELKGAEVQIVLFILECSTSWILCLASVLTMKFYAGTSTWPSLKSSLVNLMVSLIN